MFNDLNTLIAHSNWVQADQSLGLVFQVFTNHDFDFVAVLEDNVVLGLCSRRDIGMSLGSQYGFSLFASKPVKGHVLPNPVFLTLDTPINEAFAAAFTRSEETFYEDVILLDTQGEFLGLIATQSLVKLQNCHHLENIRLLERQSQEISLKNEQIEEDLRLARELQQALLPASYPDFPSHPSDGGKERLRFHHYYRPYGLVGGDFFHIKKLNDNTVGIFIADVMGHGVRAALVTAMIGAMLGELTEQEFKNPADLVSHINLELCKILFQVAETTLFATAFYVLVDVENRRIHYATAGHPLPIHVQKSTGCAEPLAHQDPGTVLGVFKQAEFANGEASYEPGDSLILYTDGIVEAENPAGEEFGIVRLRESIIHHIDHPTSTVIDRLLDRAGNFVDYAGFTDDVCLVGVDLG